VAAELRRIGLTSTAHALHVAQENQLAPDEVEALIRFWKERRPAWGPGAVIFRIRNGVPGQPASEGWPKPSPSALYAVADPNAHANAKRIDGSSRREFLSLPDADRQEVLRQVLESDAFVRGLHARKGSDNAAVISACVAKYRESKANA
jgi:hypothetical protein